jgi:hypothetical protein
LLCRLAPSHGAVHTDASGTMPPRQVEDRRALLVTQVVEGHHTHSILPDLGGHCQLEQTQKPALWRKRQTQPGPWVVTPESPHITERLVPPGAGRVTYGASGGGR